MMSVTSEEFEPPSSLNEAEERRKQLTLDVQSIQAQLGDKQRTDEDGNRLTSKEYWAWKKRAQHALNQRLNELRTTKHWIHEKRDTLFSPAAKPNKVTTVEEAVGHLKQLHSMLSVLESEDVDFDDEEKTQISAAGHFLRRAGVEEQPTQG